MARGNTRAGARTLKLRQEPVHSAVRGGVSLRQPVRGGRGGLGRGHRTTAGVSGVVGSGRSAPPPPPPASSLQTHTCGDTSLSRQD